MNELAKLIPTDEEHLVQLWNKASIKPITELPEMEQYPTPLEMVAWLKTEYQTRFEVEDFDAVREPASRAYGRIQDMEILSKRGGGDGEGYTAFYAAFDHLLTLMDIETTDRFVSGDVVVEVRNEEQKNALKDKVRGSYIAGLGDTIAEIERHTPKQPTGFRWGNLLSKANLLRRGK